MSKQKLADFLNFLRFQKEYAKRELRFSIKSSDVQESDLRYPAVSYIMRIMNKFNEMFEEDLK